MGEKGIFPNLSAPDHHLFFAVTAANKINSGPCPISFLVLSYLGKESLTRISSSCWPLHLVFSSVPLSFISKKQTTAELAEAEISRLRTYEHIIRFCNGEKPLAAEMMKG